MRAILLWTSDQSVAEAATYTTQTEEMNIHALSGIRTSDPSNRAAAHVCLRPHGHRDRLWKYYAPKKKLCTKCLILRSFLLVSLFKIYWERTFVYFETIRAALLQVFVSTNSIIIEHEVNRETDATGIGDVTKQNEARTFNITRRFFRTQQLQNGVMETPSFGDFSCYCRHNHHRI
jgi:hypothetical protein